MTKRQEQYAEAMGRLNMETSRETFENSIPSFHKNAIHYVKIGDLYVSQRSDRPEFSLVSTRAQGSRFSKKDAIAWAKGYAHDSGTRTKVVQWSCEFEYESFVTSF